MARRSSNARRRFARADNREALWKALEDGLIDMVATDHSPCPPAMKRREEGRWDLAWGGIASLGLALPVMWTAMHRRGSEHAPAWTTGRMDGRGACAAGRVGRAERSALPSARTPTSWSSIPTRVDCCTGASAFSPQDLALPRAQSCVGACWKPGCAVSASSDERSSSATPRGRELVRAMRDRASRAIAECRHIANHERGAGPHHAPLSHSTGARGSCTSARPHGSAGHDRARGCRRQSARPLATSWRIGQAPDPRLAHRHRARCRRLRRRPGRDARAGIGGDCAGAAICLCDRSHRFLRGRGRALRRALHRQPRRCRALRSACSRSRIRME